MKRLIAATAIVATGLSVSAAKADDDMVFVGHLMDITGATGFIGKFYADGVRDALMYINTHGGIDGTVLDSESVDYAYKVRTTKNGVRATTWSPCRAGARAIPKP